MSYQRKRTVNVSECCDTISRQTDQPFNRICRFFYSDEAPINCSLLYLSWFSKRLCACDVCGKKFLKNRGNEKTCSDKCSKSLQSFSSRISKTIGLSLRLFSRMDSFKCKLCGGGHKGEVRKGQEYCSDGCKRKAYNSSRKNRWIKDPNKYVAHRLRNRIQESLKGKRVSQSLTSLCGCSLGFLKQHLQAQFTDKMAWNNYGKLWHIDHIIPLASFDLTVESQLKQASHFTNLRPMIARDNISKGKKITEPQMKLLL